MPPKLIAKLKNSQLLHSIFPDRTSIVIFLLAFTLLLSFWQVELERRMDNCEPAN